MQTTLETALNVAAVTNLAPVFDAVPEGQAYPYVEIGELEETVSDVFTKNGRSVLASIHVLSEQPGYNETEAIVEQLSLLLHQAPGAAAFAIDPATGWRCFTNEYEIGTAAKEFDVVEVRHVIVRYRFELEQI